MERGPKTGYAAGSYTPVVRLGDFACDAADGGLSCSEGRLFAESDARTLRTAPFGYGGANQIEMSMSESGGVASYTHAFGAHAFRFDFEPALPPPASLRGDERFGYAVSLDGQRVVTGAITAVRDGETVTLRWTPEAPAWMAEHPMTTSLTLRPGGYGIALRAGAQ